MEKEHFQRPTPNVQLFGTEHQGGWKDLTLKANIEHRVQKHSVAYDSHVICDAFESS